MTTGSATLTSPQTFKVKPKILSFSPPSGSTGTLVTINGSGLIQATAVKFGTVKATTFTVVSDSEVTADVFPAREEVYDCVGFFPNRFEAVKLLSAAINGFALDSGLFLSGESG